MTAMEGKLDQALRLSSPADRNAGSSVSPLLLALFPCPTPEPFKHIQSAWNFPVVTAVILSDGFLKLQVVSAHNGLFLSPRSPHQIPFLFRSSSAYSDKLALIDGDLGINKGDVVLIFSPDSIESILTWAAFPQWQPHRSPFPHWQKHIRTWILNRSPNPLSLPLHFFFVIGKT
ncbi:hypothetical protein NE237_020246 [Protea cynaroides]|uniref:Uncharacterized protein n=1 Tax=Protea cynaroides TaxID=273540 RepID=A0A9Q0H5M2_9MAGN|nr:hypothetical protein NE237_020246 [Protea cynaroides]